jgi:hypothetical protein
MSSRWRAKRHVLSLALLVVSPIIGVFAAASASASAEKAYTIEAPAECVFAPGAFNITSNKVKAIFRANGPEAVTNGGQVHLTGASATVELPKEWGGAMHAFGATEARSTVKSLEIELAPTNPTVFQLAEKESRALIETEKPLIMPIPTSGTFEVGPATATANEALKMSFDPAAGYTVNGFDEFQATGHGLEMTIAGYAGGTKDFGVTNVWCNTQAGGLVTPPTNKVRPTIGGTPQQGKTIEVTSNGEWNGSPVTSYTYLWERCSRTGTSCTEIKNSENKPVTTEKYVPVAADVGHMLRLAVTAHNAAGSGKANTGTTAVISGECTNTWKGAAEGEWTTASNWEGGVPGSNSVACIASGKSAKLTSGSQQIKSLFGQGAVKITGGSLELLSAEEVSEASAITLTGGTLALASGSLTYVGSLTLEHATLTGAGKITAVSSLTWGSGGTMSGAGSTTLGFIGTGKLASPTGSNCASELTLKERTFTNEGTTTFGEGNAKLKMENGASLDNGSTGTFNLRSESGCANAAASVIVGSTTGSEPFISSNGKFVKSEGSGTSQVGVKIYNTYLVEAKVGALEFTAGAFSFSSGQPSENPAKWEAAEGAEIKLAGGKFEIQGEEWSTLGGAIKFTGGNAVLGGIHEGGSKGSQITIGGGASVLAAGTFEAGTATIEGATLNGEGLFQAKTLNLNAGATMSGSGRTSVTGKATVKSTCASPIHISEKRTLVNKGELTFGEGVIKMAEHAKAENEGSFIANSETSCSGGAQIEAEGTGSSSLILNGGSGLFEKTEKTGTTTIAVPFENQGTVEAKEGTLNFKGGGNGEEFASGAWKKTSGAITLTGGTFYIADEVTGFAPPGAQEVKVEGATIKRPTWEGFTGKTQPGAEWRPYSSTSFWNKKVTTTEETEIAPHSKEYTEKLFEHQSEEPAPLHLHVGEDEQETANDFDHPVYWASTTDPQHLLEGTEERSEHKAPISGETIRIPAGAKPAGIGAAEPDGHMVIVQPNGMEYDLWRASTPETEKPVKFFWGSKLHVNGNGQEEEENGVKLKGEATAADLPLLGGIIRPQELKAHKINHALFVVGHELEGKVWPATAEFVCEPKTMHCEPNPTPPPMGARIWLRYSDKEIEEKHLPAWKQTIAIALHEYGGYIGDSGGNANEGRTWGLEVESPESTLAFNASNDPMKTYIEEEFLAGGASQRCGPANHNSINSFRQSSWPTGTCAYLLHLNEREAPTEGEEEKLKWREGIEVLQPPAH